MLRAILNINPLILATSLALLAIALALLVRRRIALARLRRKRLADQAAAADGGETSALPLAHLASYNLLPVSTPAVYPIRFAGMRAVTLGFPGNGANTIGITNPANPGGDLVSFTLNSGKQIKSITLPRQAKINILALTLGSSTAAGTIRPRPSDADSGPTRLTRVPRLASAAW